MKRNKLEQKLKLNLNYFTSQGSGAQTQIHRPFAVLFVTPKGQSIGQCSSHFSS